MKNYKQIKKLLDEYGWKCISTSAKRTEYPTGFETNWRLQFSYRYCLQSYDHIIEILAKLNKEESAGELIEILIDGNKVDIKEAIDVITNRKV